MECAKLIAQYLSSFGTLIIGGVVAYIAWRQYQTSHDKLRLDLFEKRYKIYAAVMEFFPDMDPEKGKTGYRIMTFRADTNDACFLFGDDVVNFLSEIYKKAWHYRRNSVRLSDSQSTVHKDYEKWVDEETELLNWFHDQMNAANEVFSPYLTFKDKSY